MRRVRRKGARNLRSASFFEFPMTARVPRSYKGLMNEDMDSRLRENRYEPTGLELDDLKRRAKAQAARGERARGRRSPRLVTAFLALALMLSGGSAVIASTS